MYKPNFNTELPFKKALELLNGLAEHKFESESDSECVLFIVVKVDLRAEKILENLKVDIVEKSELRPPDDYFYEIDEVVIDIVPLADEIFSHYGHEFYWTGSKFIVRDEEREELRDALFWGNDEIEQVRCNYSDGEISEDTLKQRLYEIGGKLREKAKGDNHE